MVFLGIDVSTTATKALLIDESGQVLATAASAYGFETPHPLWSEQHPDLWWQARPKCHPARCCSAPPRPSPSRRHRPDRADARPGAAG